jgi:hypothetical protein
LVVGCWLLLVGDYWLLAGFSNTSFFQFFLLYIFNILATTMFKIYQMTYNEIKEKFELLHIGNNNVIRYHCNLRFMLNGYIVLCITYTISEYEINNNELNYYKIIGFLFTKNDKTYYSLDIVKYNNVDYAQVQLNKHNINDSTNDIIHSEIIEKIEKFPVKHKLVEYLTGILSHDKIIDIYEDNEDNEDNDT